MKKIFQSPVEGYCLKEFISTIDLIILKIISDKLYDIVKANINYNEIAPQIIKIKDIKNNMEEEEEKIKWDIYLKSIKTIQSIIFKDYQISIYDNCIYTKIFCGDKQVLKETAQKNLNKYLNDLFLSHLEVSKDDLNNYLMESQDMDILFDLYKNRKENYKINYYTQNTPKELWNWGDIKIGFIIDNLNFKKAKNYFGTIYYGWEEDVLKKSILETIDVFYQLIKEGDWNYINDNLREKQIRAEINNIIKNNFKNLNKQIETKDFVKKIDLYNLIRPVIIFGRWGGKIRILEINDISNIFFSFKWKVGFKKFLNEFRLMIKNNIIPLTLRVTIDMLFKNLRQTKALTTENLSIKNVNFMNIKEKVMFGIIFKI